MYPGRGSVGLANPKDSSCADMFAPYAVRKRASRRSNHAPERRARITGRLELFTRAAEPTLQRELKHKGAANGDGSYSAELICSMEIVSKSLTA